MKKLLSCYILLLSGTVFHQSLVAMDNPTAQTTTIMLDDEEVTVHFNDGDTCKVQTGKHKGARIRIPGYNALESYGRVHKFGDSSTEYLLSIAIQATVFAREGFWHCQLEPGKDVYGRMLAYCHDLALGLIENGLAHAYSIDETPALKDYVNAQKQAQKEQKGMWKYGIPDYILTSVHSADEGHQETYNRLICTKDGHSEKWYHDDVYETCDVVCYEEDSCMTHVPFGVRYGSKRPECL